MTSKAVSELRRSWGIVAVTLVGMCFGGSGVLWYSFGVLITPLRETFGWTNSDVSGWATFVSVGSIIGLPTIGRLADRYGVRPVVLAAIPLCALAIGLGSLVTAHIWTLYVVAIMVGTIAAGVSSLTYSRAINSWFNEARGTALGLMSSGIGLGAMFGPRIVQEMVDHHGLRSGFYTLAAMVLIPFPLMVIGLRERRETALGVDPSLGTGLTRRQAMRKPIFWLLCAASILWTLCAGGNFHLVPFLTAGGLDRSRAADYVGLLGLTAMIGRTVTGFIIDHLHAPSVCASVFFVEALAFASLGLIDVRYAFIPILVIGFAHGAEVDCFTYCTARYFGMKSYGVIFGLMSVMAAIGNGFGPLLFGFVRDLSASYRNSFYMESAFATGAALILVLAARYPFVYGSVAAESGPPKTDSK